MFFRRGPGREVFFFFASHLLSGCLDGMLNSPGTGASMGGQSQDTTITDTTIATPCARDATK